MTDAIRLPDELTIKQHRPPLEKLPPEVAERIRDMWRVGGMLSGFAELARQLERERQDRDRLRGLFHSAVSICQQLQIPRYGEVRPEDVAYYSAEIQRLDDAQWVMRDYGNDGPTGPVKVDNSIEATDADCARLACEAEVSCLHMAIELSSTSDKAGLEKLPLLHCFRRLRNVVMHCKTLDVRDAEFGAKMLDDTRPDWSVAIRFTNSWFLLVRPEDLVATRGGDKVDPVLFRAFQDLCDKYPAWFLLHAAVEQLVGYYDAK